MQHIADTNRFKELRAMCDKHDALKALESMPDAEFNAFLGSLPARVQLLVRSRMCDWREVLPEWYLSTNKKLS